MAERQHGLIGRGGAAEWLGPMPLWAMGLAVFLFTYAAVGGTVGVLWLIDLASRLVEGPPPTRPFITISSVNLLFAPIAWVGGVLATGYFSATVRAHDPDAAERASVALKRLWTCGRVAAITVIAFFVCMAIAAVLTGEFPG